MATSSSSTSAVANPKIFINHGGVDVKETFARPLYLRLREKGLTAFLDEEEMQEGYEISSQLEHVIRTASVHVAILSPRYAESSWCLNELVMMLQSNAPVIPVYYRVSPYYGEALESLEKKGRYDTNTIMEWRKALRRVASNVGLELEKYNGEELVLELLDKLVKCLSEMVPKLALYVADYPTGLGLKLKDFEDTVPLQTEHKITLHKPQFAITTSSCSTSAGANPSYKSYKIFINHLGFEVKKTFARSLYLRLREKGLTAFLDKEDLQVGYEISSQLEHVIRTASVHVAILSPRYAQSSWCLNELVMMLQSNAPVIPVFYRVRPADVRWVQCSYGEALESLEKKGRYDINTTMEWRKALRQVADNSGFELLWSNGEELVLELLDKLVKRLSEMVPKPGLHVEEPGLHVEEPDLHVADYPTGLDLKLKDFEDRVLLQKEESGKPQILGIVGLGGVGKTALAKFFFNRKRSGYSKSCFLADVRDHASKRSLHLLQGQLLKTLNGRDEQVNNVNEGKKMLGEPLKRFDTLIVFDDVDDVDQVNAFLPVQTDNLNSRSLILITSRYRGVLRNSGLEHSSIYKLSGLNEEHTQELFCSYAFSQADPLPAFQHLVDKVLECCHGLPLYLKIVGELLCNKEISEWEDELKVLKEKLPSDI